MEVIPLLIILIAILFPVSRAAQGQEQEQDQAILQVPQVSRIQFPPGFLFGTASSAYQYEGAIQEDGKSLSNWDVFSHLPGSIKRGETADITVDHYHRYMEDIELMQSLGMNAYRFSISWARILPRGRYGGVNPSGISFYNKIIDSLLLRGIQPFVTLHHYDIPQQLEDKYGSWLDPQMIEDFGHLADVCYRSFGDRVKYWVTMNEPNIIAKHSYLIGDYPPCRCSAPHGNCTTGDSETEPFLVAHNMILSHAKAAEIYRKRYKARQGGSIGIVVHAFMYEPITETPEDKQAAERALAFNVAWFLDPFIYGDYPHAMRQILGYRLPRFSRSDLKKIRNSLDFIGLNHYSAIYAKDCMHSPCESGGYEIDGFVYVTGERDGVPIGEQTGFPVFYVVPDGIERMLTYLRTRYDGTPVFITENGYAQQDIPGESEAKYTNDFKRVIYHQSYLASISRSMRSGADVRGYFIWSLLDNFEWRYGYTTRFGLHYVDFKTLRRIPKLSAKWYGYFLMNISTDDNQVVTSVNMRKSCNLKDEDGQLRMVAN